MLKLIFIFLFISQIINAETNIFFTLCYHSFLGINSEFDISPEEFEKQINAIKELGYNFIKWEDGRDGKIKGKRNILITIDDANHSVLKIYETILKKNNIFPVIFVYPAVIGKKDYAMKWNDLKKLLSDGITVGGHGYNHLYVNQKLFDSDPVAFKREIYLCKKRLNENLSILPEVYAYPFGVFSNITKEHLQKAGFKWAFSLKYGYCLSPLYLNSDPYNLPRHMVTKSSWKNIYSILKKNALNSKISE